VSVEVLESDTVAVDESVVVEVSEVSEVTTSVAVVALTTVEVVPGVSSTEEILQPGTPKLV